MAIRVQSTLYLEDRVLLAQPGFCKLSASAPGTGCTAACHGTRGVEWVAATVLRAKTDRNQLHFTVQAFPWKLQAFSRLQSPRIVMSDRFCNCHLGGETDSLCSLVSQLPRSLLEDCSQGICILKEIAL